MKIRREYELTVRIGNKMRVFTYKQASAYETMRFMEEVKEEDFSLLLWVYEFLNDICQAKRPFYQKTNISKKEFLDYAVEFQKVFETIQKTYFFGAFNKSAGETEETEESMPFDAYLTLLAGKLNIDPIKLLNDYTFEQIGELGSGVVYIMNMGSEEGKKANERTRLQTKMRDVDKDQVAATLRKLEEWQKKNQTGNAADAIGIQIDVANTITRNPIH